VHLPPQSGHRILVVDDDPDVRGFLQTLLESEGYHVDTASNGLDALMIARGAKPDLIVLDFMMPSLDGKGFRDAQLRDPGIASIPVVLTTAAADAPSLGRALGAAACFQKPFDLDQFTRTLATLCHRRRSAA
jgi:CheY-like chemotaxis protein